MQQTRKPNVKLTICILVAGCARTAPNVSSPDRAAVVHFQMQGSAICTGTTRTELDTCRGSIVTEWGDEPFVLTRTVRDFGGFGATCTLGTDGVVRCRGSNRTGLLATPLVSASSDEVPIALPARATQLGVGHFSACALLTDSSVWCWGLDPFDGTVRLPEPLDVPASSFIAVGSQYDGGAVATIADGKLYVLTGGVGGVGSRSPQGRLTPVRLAHSTPIVHAALSQFGLGLAAVDSDGAVLFRGQLESRQRLPWNPTALTRELRHYVISSEELGAIDRSTQAVSVAFGSNHVCVLTRSRTVLCVGANDFGQLGDGTTQPRRSFVDVGLSRVLSIRATGDRTCALSEEGTIHCWGREFFDPDDDTLLHALPTPTFGGRELRSVSLSRDFSGYIVEADGSLFGWAINNYQAPALVGVESDDPTGSGSPRPPLVATRVALPERVASNQQAGPYCVVLESGRVSCWFDLVNAAPRALEVPFPAQSVVSGASEVCVQGRSGQLTCATVQRAERTMIGPWRTYPALLQITSLSGSSSHLCASTAAGEAYCWGSNVNGELAIREIGGSDVPLRISGLPFVRQVEVAHGRTCALTIEGAYCWGSNVGHAFSSILDQRVTRPTALSVPATVRSVAMGYDSTCVLSENGRVFCTGTNYWGQLGVGWRSRGTTEWVVAALPPASAVVGGDQTYCALLQRGGALCWGSRRFNELGDGAPRFQRTPTILPRFTR